MSNERPRRVESNAFWRLWYSHRRGEAENTVKIQQIDEEYHTKDGLLYRVKSCPGIVAQTDDIKEKMPQIHLELQLNENQQETLVRLRVRNRQSRHPNNQTQRYSCGSLDQKSADLNSMSPFGSLHSSNPSLTHASGVFGSNGFSVIQVS